MPPTTSEDEMQVEHAEASAEVSKEDQNADSNSSKSNNKNKDGSNKRKLVAKRQFTIKFDDMHLGEEYSAFMCIEKCINYPVLPAAIGSERYMISQVLVHNWKGSYRPELDGVLCYFDRLQIVDQKCEIRDDLPFIYVYFTGRFYVFRPKVNSIARAKITCFLQDNNVVNCTIADCFNAVITLPEKIPDMLSQYLILNQEIFFRITDVCYNPLTVYGDIDKTCVKLTKKQIPLLTEPAEDVCADKQSLDDFFVS